MTLLELTEKEKDLFFNWLQEREKILIEEMEILKGLHAKLEVKPESKAKVTLPHSTQADTKINPLPKEDATSWVSILKKELALFSSPVPSGEIVKRLLQKPSYAEKGKRFITKAVTSKLWLLQERGEVIKSRENGRYLYFLKN